MCSDADDADDGRRAEADHEVRAVVAAALRVRHAVDGVHVAELVDRADLAREKIAEEARSEDHPVLEETDAYTRRAVHDPEFRRVEEVADDDQQRDEREIARRVFPQRSEVVAALPHENEEHRDDGECHRPAQQFLHAPVPRSSGLLNAAYEVSRPMTCSV